MKQRGMTAVEFAVVLLVLSVLLAGLAWALGYVQEQAEKTMVRYGVMALESGLKLEAASRMARGREGEIAHLANEDPFQWVDPKPQGYRGEWKDPAADRAAEPGWYWDGRRREAVYVLDRGDRFRPGPSGKKEIRYRIKAEGGGGVRVALWSVEAYEWF
jgi:prepilin-type N-terminal cleavage/methylation domain-containing protein